MTTATLIAVQLAVGDAALASADAYRRAIDDATAAAVDAAGARATSSTTLIVFPELAGHLALYALAPVRARRATTLAGALAAAALRRPLDVLRGVATARVLDPRHAVLAALAPDGEQLWRGIFGPLARRYAAYVVAGSHLRLAPSGELTNASMTFHPDGRLLATTDKVNLKPGFEDGAPGALKLARGSAARVPVVEVPGLGGGLATLIGYDAFTGPDTTHERWEPVAARLATRGGTIAAIANPAANRWPWLGPWPPAGMVGARASAATRADHWASEGLRATLAAVARFGVTAHLVGQVLDLHFAGVSEILERAAGAVAVLARAEDATHGGHVHARVETGV